MHANSDRNKKNSSSKIISKDEALRYNLPTSLPQAQTTPPLTLILIGLIILIFYVPVTIFIHWLVLHSSLYLLLSLLLDLAWPFLVASFIINRLNWTFLEWKKYKRTMLLFSVFLTFASFIALLLFSFSAMYQPFSLLSSFFQAPDNSQTFLYFLFVLKPAFLISTYTVTVNDLITAPIPEPGYTLARHLINNRHLNQEDFVKAFQEAGWQDATLVDRLYWEVQTQP